MLFHKLSSRKITLPHARIMYYFKIKDQPLFFPNSDLPLTIEEDVLMSDIQGFNECVRSGKPFYIEVVHESRCQENLNQGAQPLVIHSAIADNSKKTRISGAGKPISLPSSSETTSHQSIHHYRHLQKQIECLTKTRFHTGVNFLMLENEYNPESVKVLSEMEDESNEVTGEIQFEINEENEHFRQSMARLRQDLQMPIARCDPEYLQQGFNLDLPVQKMLHTPTFLSLLPKDCPEVFLIHIRLLDGVTLRPIKISRHHTVRQTILDLIEQTKTPAGVKTITRSIDELTLKLMGKGQYFLPFELVISKLEIRNAIAQTPPGFLELSLTLLENVYEQASLTEADKTLRKLDSFVPPEPPHIPYLPFSSIQNVSDTSSFPFISSWDAHVTFSFRILGVDNISTGWSKLLMDKMSANKDKPLHIEEYNSCMYIAANIYFGGQPLNKMPMYSQLVPSCSSPRFDCVMSSAIKINQIPAASRVCLTLYIQETPRYSNPGIGQPAVPNPKDDYAISWVSCPVFDFRGALSSGLTILPLWPDEEANPIGSCTANIGDPKAPKIVLDFPEFFTPVIFPREYSDKEEEDFLVKQASTAVRTEQARSFSVSAAPNFAKTSGLGFMSTRSPAPSSPISSPKAKTQPVTKPKEATPLAKTSVPLYDFEQHVLEENVLAANSKIEWRKQRSPIALQRPRSISERYVQKERVQVKKMDSQSQQDKTVTIYESILLIPRFSDTPVLEQLPLEPPTAFSSRLNFRITEGASLPTEQDWHAILSVISKDPLVHLEKPEKSMLWLYRFSLVDLPQALPKFLHTINWTSRKNVVEAHYLLRRWKPLNPIDAMELLDAKFADPLVREYAVKWMYSICDDDLAPFILQLVQVLKNELYHSSPLGEFLMRRALGSPHTIGHTFFWNLKSEIHNKYIAERYGLMLQEYLKGCGFHRHLLREQIGVLTQLVQVAYKVVASPKDQGKAVMLAEMQNVKFPSRFILPLSPDFEASNLVTDKCRVMVSKKRPMWLTFANAEQGLQSVSVLFKVGDDIRQDQLTLQILSVMDLLWQREGLDMRLSVYHAQTTGNMQGFIEAVKNSQTIAAIAKEHDGALGAFKSDTLKKWLQNVQNKHSLTFEQVQENFAYSCAGYCVATYVLGIGDRHNDNLMCTYDGHLFHIDFGHFLGNFKKKFGIDREKAPFIFTPAFAAVLGEKTDPMYVLFEELCVKAYITLRKHSALLINLFMMMLSTGIPELRQEDDIRYMQRMFNLNLSDEDAGNLFIKLIDEARNTTRTQINDFIHIAAN
ncbi:putative Phosphatidylinositol 3-kinase 1 [Blattamonas nauphoetae]|uniref:Phosphatidylinositol 3-kinase 1 n=1 Tax=Blattamonas nauphoetae TaxID=2049346 RepID=A0ABQ9Y6Q0_9EUKA|nr:putative Phosphatidylinositol 3-kinase 1 [Blattamonas nauphoetae]